MTPDLAAQIANDSLYQEFVRPRIFGDALPVTDPELVMVAGPPGIGKTSVMKASTISVETRTGAQPIVLDADVLREFVDGYEQVKHDPQAMIAHTSDQVNTWMEYAREEAREGGYSVVVQRAMREPEWQLEEIANYKEAGYRVTLAPVAGLQAESRLGIVGRYLDGVARDGVGRSVPEGFHQEAWTNLRVGVVDAAAAGDVDRIEIWDRFQPGTLEPRPLAIAENTTHGWRGLDEAVQAFDERRQVMPEGAREM